MTNSGNPQLKSLRYRNAFGVREAIEVAIGSDLALPGAMLPARIVVDRTGRRMVQKWVPQQIGDGAATNFDLLDREIRAGTRLAQAFAGIPYPVELTQLIGYNVDGREPFVLLDEYRGEPATQHANRLTLHERHRFQVSLLRALLHTSACGVIHGGVSLTALRWDGNNLQLVDFEQAYQVGEPRQRSSMGPSRSPEQTDGVGTADARDDIWGAGAVIHEITTGRHTNGGRYDLSQDPESLRFLLHGVFSGQANARPEATELLKRLRADTSVQIAPGPAKVLAAGRQAFEEACARKRGVPAEPPSPPPPPPESATSAMTLLVGGGVVLLVVLIAVMILGAMT